MTYLQTLLSELSAESAKPVPAYEMTLEDYFKPDAELEMHLDAVEMIESQLSIAESTIERFEQGGVKMNAAALAIVTSLAMTAAPSIFKEGLGNTLSSEENGIGDLALSTEKMKDKMKQAKNLASDLLTKAINFVMDFYRKFKTGTDKLVTSLKAAKEKAKDVEVKEAKPALFIGDKAATAAGVKEMVKQVIGYADMLKGGDVSIADELMVLGGKKVVIAGKDGKFSMKEEAVEVPSKEVKMSKSDVEGLIDAMVASATLIGKIDHKAVTTSIQKSVEADREKEKGGNSAYLAKALRALTVKLPSQAASGMAKVPGALGL